MGRYNHGTIFGCDVKNNHMRRIIFSAIIFSIFVTVKSQVAKTDVLQDLEKNQSSVQNAVTSATLKSASRLFRDNNDLTSVITVLPKGTVVNVLPGSYDTFMHVEFEGEAGYVYTKDAELSKAPPSAVAAAPRQYAQKEAGSQASGPVQKQVTGRYEYLVNTYGSSVGSRLYERKIWKGMNSQLVKESWGSPAKINRVVNGDEVREEWTYNKTMLYFRNSTLSSWGPVK
jgi:hypothetical protein